MTDAADMGRFHHLDEMEEAARRRLPDVTYQYVAGGAGQERAIRRNRDALDALLLIPRVLRGIEAVSTSASVLGGDTGMPLLVAPSAVQRLAHPGGELATARAARDAGLIMVLSMNSSVAVEEVAETGVGFWMQIYCSTNREHTAGIVERAEAAGAGALCLTVDQAALPRRLRELHTPLEIPDGVRFAHLSTDPAERPLDRSISWATVAWLRSVSHLPIVLKGVLHPDDAVLAAEHDVAAVIVSNHGGRQLDGSVSGYDMVESVVDAVDGRLEVLVDGGIRSGTDLLKVMALGANAGLIGRPIWWGLAVGGEAGVARVLELIRTDLEVAMALCGVADIDSIGPGLLHRPHR